MKLYTIGCQVASKETGSAYPQLEICEEGSYKDPYSIVNLSDKTNLERTGTKFAFRKKAKVTDMISWGSLQYPVISNRMKSILSSHNLFGVEFIPIKIKNHENESWWVLNPRYSNEALDLIDYDKTIFGELDPDTRKIIREFKFPLNTADWWQQWLEERRNFSEKYHELVFCEIHLTEAGNKYDMIHLSPLLNISGTVISDRLKERLEREKITGLSISEFEWGNAENL